MNKSEINSTFFTLKGPVLIIGSAQKLYLCATKNENREFKNRLVTF